MSHVFVIFNIFNQICMVNLTFLVNSSVTYFQLNKGEKMNKEERSESDKKTRKDKNAYGCVRPVELREILVTLRDRRLEILISRFQMKDWETLEVPSGFARPFQMHIVRTSKTVFTFVAIL